MRTRSAHDAFARRTGPAPRRRGWRQSDRFPTVEFRPEVYSPLGMDRVANGRRSQR